MKEKNKFKYIKNFTELNKNNSSLNNSGDSFRSAQTFQWAPTINIDKLTTRLLFQFLFTFVGFDYLIFDFDLFIKKLQAQIHVGCMISYLFSFYKWITFLTGRWTSRSSTKWLFGLVYQKSITVMRKERLVPYALLFLILHQFNYNFLENLALLIEKFEVLIQLL